MPWRPLCGKFAPNCRRSGPGLPRLGRRHRHPPPARVDGCGATLEQKQEDQTIRRILFISRVTIESERHWTALYLVTRESPSRVWSINRLRVLLWGTAFCVVSGQKVLESPDTIAEHNPRAQPWEEFPVAYKYTLEYRKGSASGSRRGPFSPATACDEG